MKDRFVFSSLLFLALSLTVVPTAMASTTWYVDGVNGSDSNNCKTRLHACKTIGHAILLAHSGDSIKVAAATYTENLGIGFNLKIVGSAANTTIIDGGGVNTVVTISNANAHVALSKVTITKGFAQVVGGGIINSGTLIVNKSTVSGNHAGAGKIQGYGGGIANSGTLTINNSTVSGNSARNGILEAGTGGGIGNIGLLTITNSTLSGNESDIGGGIYNLGTLTITNSTLSANCIGGGIYTEGPLTINNSTFSGNNGGGISASNTTSLQNTIVANSTSGANCSGTMTSDGYNLSSDNTCNFNNTGDLNNTDPKLGQLGNYGGPTQTMPLLSGSPAIDAGNPSGCTDGKGHPLKSDQRGKPRPDKEDHGIGCDMGAYERQAD
jgi:hypothetical protein